MSVKGNLVNLLWILQKRREKEVYIAIFIPKKKAREIANEKLNKTDLRDEVEGQKEDEDEVEAERKDNEGERDEKHEVEVEG